MSSGSYIIFIGILAILIYSALAKSSFKFTNLKCEDHDVSFAHFETCRLNVIRRGVISLNIRVGLYKTPVTNSTVNIAIYKRANGYRPFLYNITQDVCAFFANRKRYPVLKVIFSVFLKDSNLNHTCPYNDAIVVKDLVLEENLFRLLPLPGGQYKIKIMVSAYNDLKATVEVMFSCVES